MCDKIKLTLQNPLGPPDVCVLQSTNGSASHCSPSLLPCPTAGTVHCPFLALTSLHIRRFFAYLIIIRRSKASYYYFRYCMKCLPQLRQAPEQSEVWEHQTRLCPTRPCSSLPGMKVPPSIICLTPALQNYFLILSNHFRREHCLQPVAMPDIFCWTSRGPNGGFCIFP